MKWYSPRVRRYSEKLTQAHGRLEQRHIAVLEVDDSHRFDFKQVRQAFRSERDREVLKETDSASTEVVYGITSVAAERADAKQLLQWNRGYWAVENRNHYIRDCTFQEDTYPNRTGNSPSNRAMCNNIAPLIFLQQRFESAPQALHHFNLNRNEAFAALFSRPERHFIFWIEHNNTSFAIRLWMLPAVLVQTVQFNLLENQFGR